MTHSPQCVTFIGNFEGCRLEAYQDQRGIWTIGYGHTGIDVTKGSIISQVQANLLLNSDLASTDCFLNKVITAKVNQNQFDALVSLTFNIGIGNFEKSTVLKELNTENYNGAAKAFLLWDNTNHIVNPGLLRRREAEQALFLKG